MYTRWIIGTGYITRAGGIAYVATNIYFSSWFALFSCIYTLNEWSASKDILSITELTRLSATLKSWWVLTLTSMVVRSNFMLGPRQIPLYDILTLPFLL
jgi:hypothetical protein